MRTILYTLSLLLTLLAWGAESQAQVVITTTVRDSCYVGMGTSDIFFGIDFTGPGSSSVVLIENSYGDGTKDTAGLGGFPMGFRTFVTHTYSSAGTYTVKHVAIGTSSRLDSTSYSVTAQCSFIGGYLFNDANSNCLMDAAEPLIHGVARIKVDSAGVPVDTVSAMGSFNYKARALATTTYTFTLLANPAGYVRTCPSTNSISYTFSPGMTSIPPQNFGFNCASAASYDYQLYFSRALRGATSGGSSYIYLNATNNSCHVGTGTVTLNVSPKYTITTSGIIPPPTSVSGNTVVWTVTGLSNGIYKTMYVPLAPKSTTNNGDTACNVAVITPLAGDVNVSNNTVGGCDSVKSSWDPNEKSVATTGMVQGGSVLNYTIDFENLGNDTAFNIHVMDTLSNRLDANSFVLLGATHRVIPVFSEMGNGTRILKFDFPNIKLEDKTVPTRNKGQVRFSMKLKAGALAPGTTISNRAGIYFDGNPPVITNYATVKVPLPQSVPGQTSGDQVQAYPNPAYETLSVEVKAGGWNEAQLCNILGQSVLKSTLNPGINILSTKALPAGIYYLQIRGGEGMISQKIEKR